MFPDERTRFGRALDHGGPKSAAFRDEILDPLAGLPDQPDFVGFFHQALVIHQLSRSQAQEGKFYSVPVASLRALRDMLDRPEWRADRQRLAEGLGMLRPQLPPSATAVLLGKLIWEVVLRRYGIDRGHIGSDSFQITVVQPQNHDPYTAGYGDFAVKVKLEAEIYDLVARRIPGAWCRVQFVQSAEWLLGAFYTYAYELGLRPTPWWQRSPRRRPPGMPPNWGGGKLAPPPSG